MSLTKYTDYIGFYQIAKGSGNTDRIQTYIDEIEPVMLRNLLGCALYDLFIADIDPITNKPVTARFLSIYNAINVDVSTGSGEQKRSLGMVEMLKGFTYYNFVGDSDFFNTISGNVSNQFSNSLSVNAMQIGLTERYNLGKQTYDVIQWFICDNSTDYPEYNGLNIEVITWLD